MSIQIKTQEEPVITQRKIVLSENVELTEIEGLAHVSNPYERLSLNDAILALIIAALKRTGGNVERTARQLNITRTRVHNQLRRRGLSVKDWRRK